MKKQKIGVIYCITNTLSNKKYIGQTTTPQQRKNDHYGGNGGAKLLNRAMEKYGTNNFEWSILEDNIPETELDRQETHYIEHHKTVAPNGYNLTEGGGGARGYKHSTASRAKIAAARYGTKLSAETRKKQSNAAKKRYEDPKEREQARRLNLGRKLPLKQRQKLSASKKGKPPWNKGKKGIYSKAYKEKLSTAQNKRFKNPKERNRISRTKRGRPLSEKTKQNMKGHIPWNKGQKGAKSKKSKTSPAQLKLF